MTHYTTSIGDTITADEAADLIGPVVAGIARQLHPLAPPALPFVAARELAYRLARIITLPVHVVTSPGGYRIFDDDQIDAGFAPRASIVYTCDFAHIAAL
jgi:hypothetical protein